MWQLKTQDSKDLTSIEKTWRATAAEYEPVLELGLRDMVADLWINNNQGSGFCLMREPGIKFQIISSVLYLTSFKAVMDVH